MSSSKIALGCANNTAYMLDASKLRPGDVILTKSPQKESKVIRFFTIGTFSHVLLVVEPPNAMESADSGVVRFRCNRIAVRCRDNIRVLRVKEEITFDRDSLVMTADSFMGSPYALIDAIFSIIPFVPQAEHGHLFCSMLVAECFLRAGLEIVPGADPLKTTPAKIARSPIFDDKTSDILLTRDVAKPPFDPTYFDDVNEMTPNEDLTKKSQLAIDKIRAKFKLHGYDVPSREKALVVLADAFLQGAPFAQELDRELAAAYRDLDIPGLAARWFPPTSDAFFMDLVTGQGILQRKIDKIQARELYEYYEEEIQTGAKTLAERHLDVEAERAAFFNLGSEAIWMHLVANTEINHLHRRYLDTIVRTNKLLRMYVKHDGTMPELDEKFRRYLFPEVTSYWERKSVTGRGGEE